jgi:hypothetical protein
LTDRKHLIELSIPLDVISAQSAREKSIRHGHISTLHIWWARRPLAACRAATSETRAATSRPTWGRAALPSGSHLYPRALGELAGFLQRGH